VFDRMAPQRRQPGGHVALAETGPPRNDMIAVVGGLILYVVFLVWLHPALDRHPTFAVNPGNRAQNKVALGSILRCKNPYILPPRIALCVTCSGVNRRG